MMTAEERKVLTYLQKHTFTPVTELVRACLPGATLDSVRRIIADLEWLNNLTVYYGKNGEPVALQITDKGVALARVMDLSYGAEA
jgi:hypothetical protein